MGRKKQVTQMPQTIRGRKLGPRHRVDISKIRSVKQRRELEEFATRIQALVELQTDLKEPVPEAVLQEAAHILKKPLHEVTESINQFIAYHACFPGEHPANAFTPTESEYNSQKRDTEHTQSERPMESDTSSGGNSRPIKQRPHINSVPEPERSELIARAEKYQELNDIEDVTGGTLPPGMLEAAARELGETKDWVTKQRKHLRAYHTVYPEDPLGTSLSPLKRGRPKGRLAGKDAHTEATKQREQIIEEARAAYLNTTWLSREGDENHSTEHYSEEDDVRVGPHMIAALIKKRYGDILSESTIWRILEDFRKEEMPLIEAARGSIDDVRQQYFPSIDNDVVGPGARIQIDIRPLPKRVKIADKVESTVYVAWIVDDYSRASLAYDIITRKVIGKDRALDEVDFTCKQIRILIARFIIKTGKRPRIIYVDRGPQFYKALEKYMSFLIAPGEGRTKLINRRRARGGGKVENTLKLISEFLQYTRGTINESHYRQSYARTKTKDLKTFEQFKQDFATFEYHWNHDLAPDGGPSRWQVWEGGPDQSLSPPPEFNLAAFASGERRVTRQWTHHEGFEIDTDYWFPANPSVELYKKLAHAEMCKQEVPIIICTFQDEGGIHDEEIKLVFFSLDEGATWIHAVKKGQVGLSARKHQKMLDQLEHELGSTAQRTSDHFFKEVLLKNASGPLIIDGLSRTKGFIFPGEHPPYAPPLSTVASDGYPAGTATTAEDIFDPFGGRDPIDIPMDERFGPGGIIETYFEDTETGLRLKPDAHVLAAAQNSQAQTCAADTRAPDADVTALSDGNTPTDRTPSVPSDSEKADGRDAQEAAEQQTTSDEQPSTALTATPAESPAVSAPGDATPARKDNAYDDTDRSDQSEAAPPPAPTKPKFGFIARRTAQE